MGAGCSTEISQPTVQEKSHVNENTTKTPQSQSRDRKQSTVSVNGGSNKVKQFKTSVQPQSNRGSKEWHVQNQPAVIDNNITTSVNTNSSESEDSAAARSTTNQGTSVVPSTTTSKIRDVGKRPPRLTSLTPDLQDLLTGNVRESCALTIRPQVLHLHVIAPEEECMTERASLLSRVFMPLRTLCAERGYVLNIDDDLWLSQSLERTYTHRLVLREITDSKPTQMNGMDKENGTEMSADVVLVAITDSCSLYRLPRVLSCENYTTIVSSLPDPDTTTLAKELYSINENCVPPAYELTYHVLSEQDETTLNRLVHLMMAVFQRENKEISVFYSDYYTQLLFLQQSATLLSENTVIISKLHYNKETNGTGSNQHVFNQDKDTNIHIYSLLQCFEEECQPENMFQYSLQELECTAKDDYAMQQQLNSTCLDNMAAAIRTRLETVLLQEIEKKGASRLQSATGVPRSLVEELISQAAHYKRLIGVEALLKSPTLTSLQEYVTSVSEMPIVVYAEPGWGLSTLAAQLIHSCLTSGTTSVIIYRFMGISPDSRTLMSTLLSIKQQIDTLLGPSMGTWCLRQQETDQMSAVETLLSDIASRSTSQMPLLIILEGVFLASGQLRELDVMTMTELLPATTKLLVMTSNLEVARELRIKIKDAFYVKASSWDQQILVSLFTNRLHLLKRTVSDNQMSACIAAIHKCPVPMYAASTATLASTWNSVVQISDGDLPNSVEGILNKLCEDLEHCIPPNCFCAMMAYLTVSVGGISTWEMADLLSNNDYVVSTVKYSSVYTVPSILWKLINSFLRSHLNLFLSTHFYTYSWTSNSFRKCAVSRYASSNDAALKVHKYMSEYFMGHCTTRIASLSDARVSKYRKQEPRRVMPQPDTYSKHLNVRKFMCLPSHLMAGNYKSAYILETCILNLPWIENKLNCSSIPQVLNDLEQAKYLATSCSCEIKIIQQAILQAFDILQVQGKEIYKCLHHFMTPTSGASGSDAKAQDKCIHGLMKMFACLANPRASLLHTLDNTHVCLSQIADSTIPAPIIDAIVPVSNDALESHVVVTLSAQNQLRIINIVTNQTVRTLTGVDAPKNVLMLESTNAVVQCNRELAVIDLDQGKLLIKLRGVLNLQMPFFGLQCDRKVVALSRDRMVVNILDISTGGIVATFKAGETRFLDSLIISGDGRILVCGDETQKPFPLLVWSLEQSKLLHDIRMAQHEFVTRHASISYNGHYLACVCKEVSDSTSNFVVVYDLISGQLFKKFKMGSICTAVNLMSKTMGVLIALDSGQLAVWDLMLGSLKFLMDGAPVAMNNIIITSDESMCLTTHKDDSSISSHTLSLWNILMGRLEACHTFDCPITCAQFSPDSHMILAGIKGHPNLVRLICVPEGRTFVAVKAEWEKEKDNANVFGDVSRKDKVINMDMDIT